MSRFVRVRDNFGEEYVISADNVSWISAETYSVCMSGTHHAGNGILRICPKDIQRLLSMTGVVDDAD